jgi:hypothetical protein
MRLINVEITMGLSASYYKPTKKEKFWKIIKTVNLLTISNDNVIYQKSKYNDNSDF